MLATARPVSKKNSWTAMTGPFSRSSNPVGSSIRCYHTTINGAMKGLTDIPGIRVGHISDYQALTGCTAILCEAGAVGGVDIRGSASGTQEIDVLSPGHVTDKVHGILLAGGSAFGLEAAAGVRRYLASRKVGFA